MDDRTFIRQFEGFHSRKFVAYTVLGVLGFALVLAVVVFGFRRNHVYRSADAITFVQPSPTSVGPAPAPAPVR